MLSIVYLFPWLPTAYSRKSVYSYHAKKSSSLCLLSNSKATSTFLLRVTAAPYTNLYSFFFFIVTITGYYKINGLKQHTLS